MNQRRRSGLPSIKISDFPQPHRKEKRVYTTLNGLKKVIFA